MKRTLLKLGERGSEKFPSSPGKVKTLCKSGTDPSGLLDVFTVAKVEVMEGLFFQQHYRGRGKCQVYVCVCTIVRYVLLVDMYCIYRMSQFSSGRAKITHSTDGVTMTGNECPHISTLCQWKGY